MQNSLPNSQLPQKKIQQFQPDIILMKDPQDNLIQFGVVDYELEKDGLVNYHSYEDQRQNNEDQQQYKVDKLIHSFYNHNHQPHRNYQNDNNVNRIYRQTQGQHQNIVDQNHTLPAVKRKCICKKTQCLKMYCQCFASNLPCTAQCTCVECKNTLQHQKQIYQAKVMIRQKGIVGLHSCSLSQKRCNCKKSNCLKKYCECYNSGVNCSDGCKCVNCKNSDNPYNSNDQKQKGNKQSMKVQKKSLKKQKKSFKKQKSSLKQK